MKKLNLSCLSSGYIPLAFMFLLIIIVKIVISFYFKSPWIFADETVYAETARNILKGEFYSKLQYPQTYPPGYSFFLSIAYLLFDNSTANYRFMLIINSVLNASIIFPAYFLLKKYCSEKFSLMGSFFVAILPSVVLYNYVIMSENLFIPLFTFSVWFLIESLETNSKKWGILAGLSLFLLFLTRSTGLAMIIGFFIALVFYFLMQLKLKDPAIILKENSYSVMAFFIPTILWIYYKSKLEVTAGNYDIEAYKTTIFLAVSNIQSFIRFFILIVHEIEFLILSSYFVLFILAFYSLSIFLRNSDGSLQEKETQKTMSMKSGILYFLVSSIVLIIITAAHMYPILPPEDLYYSIFGRYIDPIVPVIVIFGLIGFYFALNKDTEKKQIISLLIASTLVLTFLFAISFPYKYYKLPNMFSIFYIQGIKEMIAVELFIFICAIIFLSFCILSISQKKLWFLIFIVLIIFSLIGMNYTIRAQYEKSLAIENDPVTEYLVNHSDDSSIILMSIGDYYSEFGVLEWYSKQFFIQGYLIQTKNESELTSPTYQNDRHVKYIISQRILPYQVLAVSRFGYKLYNLEPREKSIVVLPYMINIGSDAKEKIENFYPSENNQSRWTKNQSRIVIEYPENFGDMKLTMKIEGSRPVDNPAKIVFKINNFELKNITYTGNTQDVTIIVPQRYLTEHFQMVEIDTNTWRPSNYGSPDMRDLGIQLDWLEIQNKSFNY
jgi:hypothetical protein